MQFQWRKHTSKGTWANMSFCNLGELTLKAVRYFRSMFELLFQPEKCFIFWEMKVTVFFYWLCQTLSWSFLKWGWLSLWCLERPVWTHIHVIILTAQKRHCWKTASTITCVYMYICVYGMTYCRMDVILDVIKFLTDPINFFSILNPC